MDTRVARREITRVGPHKASLHVISKVQLDFRPDGRRTARIADIYKQPVSAAWDRVGEIACWRIAIENHDVHATIVVEIGEDRAATRTCPKRRNSAVLDRLESQAILPSLQKQIVVRVGIAIHHFGIRQHRAVGRKVVEPPVVVEIHKAQPEPGVSKTLTGEPCLRSHISKVCALVDVERIGFALQIAHDQIGRAVVVEIGDAHTHAGLGKTGVVAVTGHVEAGLFERAVTAVLPETIGHGVVGNEHVSIAIAVEVGRHHAEPVALHRRNPTGLSGISEVTAAIIEVEEIGRWRIPVRFAVVRCLQIVESDAKTWQDGFRRPLDIAAYEQVQVAIAVGIEKGRAGPPLLVSDVALGGDVGEVSTTVVAKQYIGIEVAHEQIDITVAVHIASGHARGVANIARAAAFGHILKGAVTLVAKESVAALARGLKQIEIHPAVVIEVERSATTDNDLRHPVLLAEFSIEREFHASGGFL